MMVVLRQYFQLILINLIQPLFQNELVKKNNEEAFFDKRALVQTVESGKNLPAST